MAIWQGGSRRKVTGGRRVLGFKKRRFQIGRESVLTTLGVTRRKKLRTRGANEKSLLLLVGEANVTDSKKGTTTRATITNVIGNPANVHYVRRNILTKGAVLETSAGKARVTSRPGQNGVVNAVLVE